MCNKNSDINLKFVKKATDFAKKTWHEDCSIKILKKFIENENEIEDETGQEKGEADKAE